MKKIIILFCFCFVFLNVQAQQIQWASKVIKFSSDLGGKQNGIKRILGKPDVFPQGGNSGNAWTPKNALDGREIVEVGFEKPQTVKQVAVFENLNAGCVSRIWVDKGSGNYDVVWSRKSDWRTPTFKSTARTDHDYYFKRKRRKINETPDVYNPGIENAVLESAVANVVAVKVEFNFALLPGQKQIDAIGISDSEIPIQATINTSAEFENLANKNTLNLNVNEIGGFSFSVDGQNMFVINKTDGADQVFTAERQADGKWSEAKFNTDLSTNETYNYVVYSDANILVKGGANYTRNSTETGFHFFENKNGNYQMNSPLKITAYNNYQDTADMSMSRDGKIIIMGIETDFSQGGTDLYFANKKEDGTFGLLQNMGKNINSAADELLPQLLSDNSTLIFSSNGYSGYGDYDLFVSYRLDDSWKKWSEPINLGSKINSADFEGSPFYDEQNEIFYFLSVIDGKSTCNYIKFPKAILMKKL
ncbi:hypothetical protein [Flavobacterium flavipallidum]|uniref:WD40 repeat protein n=1 Tax=Flavobacterium flavipallidum TaxID=3139140 RepID=A0ABU9HI02_9FLAO